MDKNRRRFGLIGYPLAHSFSKRYFTEKFEREGIADACYELFPLENIEGFPELLAEQNPRGLNVTIPHKKAIMGYLDTLDRTAQTCGAVNVIHNKEGHLTGYNTDYTGFRQTLQPLLKPEHKKALVLGTGGASGAVAAALQDLDISYKKVSRHPSGAEVSYSEVKSGDYQEYLLWINTTPLGMEPQVDACPDMPYEQLDPHHLVYDLVYNPKETLFLKRAKVANAHTQNGLAMLYAQAEAAWAIWNQH